MQQLRFFISAAFIALLFGSCSNKQEASKPAAVMAPPGSEPAREIPAPELWLYAANVDNLRLREQPNQSAPVKAQLKAGELAEGNGTVSSNQDEIELRGIPYKAPYYQVSTTKPDRQSGWAFGAALTCVYTGSRQESPDMARLNQWSGFLQSLNVKKLDSGAKAWAGAEKNLANANGSLADAAFILLERFLRRMEFEGEYYKMTEKVNWTPEDFEAIYKDNFDPNKYPQTKALTGNGFRMMTAEGMVYPQVDWRKFQAFFGPRVSPAMKSFIDQRTKEQNRPMYSDGGLIIPLQDLADLAIFWENFNRNHPYFPMGEETRESQRWTRLSLVNGSDNTPIFDPETQAITADFKNVWTYIQQKYPGTELARYVKQMADLCASEGWKRTKKVEDFQTHLIEESTAE